MEVLNPIPPARLHPVLKKILERSDPADRPRRIKGWIRRLEKRNPVAALQQLKLVELHQKSRKPRLAIYDHAFHFIGGAQKYGLTIAQALKDDFDITLISNKPVNLADFREWYDMDLSFCTLKTVSLDFFDRMDPVYIDPAKVNPKAGNPFLAVSKVSARYDIFLNNSMLEMVYPLSCYSVMVCHFPERRPVSYFYADHYHQVIFNSRYTRGWIEKRWGFTPHTHVYPPVDMEADPAGISKENLIISVARFDPGGNKKQLALVRAFSRLNNAYPEVARKWQLVLIGGSTLNNPYLSRIETYIREKRLSNCQVRVNLPEAELKKYYARARIFWHLCGLGQDDPAKVEHFGMTIAEAMQNRVIPLVYDGGGQREIVENDVNGYRVTSSFELIQHTVRLMKNPRKMRELGQNAWQKSRSFSRDRFCIQIRKIFLEILQGFWG